MKQFLLFSLVSCLCIRSFSQIDDKKIYRWGNLNPWEVTEFAINSKHYYENTVNVIAPGKNTACPNGKIVVMTGQPRPDRRMIISNLMTNDGKINTSKGTDVQLGINENSGKLATDNQIIKLKNGDLLAIKLGFLWSSINPKPFWSDWVTDDVTDNKKMARDAIYVYKSSDCGETWAKVSTIDATKIDNGQYGIPKISKDDDDDEDNNGQNSTLYHSNGFDRQEVYYDEASNILYMTTQIASGEYKTSSGGKEKTVPKIDEYGLFVSNNNGVTWHLKYKTSSRMLVMTTTLNGRFFMFCIKDSKPTLFYTKNLKDYTLNSITSVEIKYPESGTPIKAEKDSEIHQKNKLATYSISRGPGSSVYLTYPVLNSNGKCEYVLCNVKINDEHPALFGIANYASMRIKASDPALSLSYGTLVESKAESPYYLTDVNTKITPKTLLYYIESTSGDGVPAASKKVAVKGILIDHKTNQISDDFFLSRDANNAGRWFKPYSVPNNGGIGHYTKGISYIHNDKQNYIAQWPEPDGIHISIVSGVDLWRKDDKEILKDINEMSKQKIFQFPVLVNKQ
jgi:hypothetical protein